MLKAPLTLAKSNFMFKDAYIIIQCTCKKAILVLLLSEQNDYSLSIVHALISLVVYRATHNKEIQDNICVHIL